MDRSFVVLNPEFLLISAQVAHPVLIVPLLYRNLLFLTKPVLILAAAKLCFLVRTPYPFLSLLPNLLFLLFDNSGLGNGMYDFCLDKWTTWIQRFIQGKRLHPRITHLHAALICMDGRDLKIYPHFTQRLIK